jgi:hypothetical protein
VVEVAGLAASHQVGVLLLYADLRSGATTGPPWGLVVQMLREDGGDCVLPSLPGVGNAELVAVVGLVGAAAVRAGRRARDRLDPASEGELGGVAPSFCPEGREDRRERPGFVDFHGEHGGQLKRLLSPAASASGAYTFSQPLPLRLGMCVLTTTTRP